MGIKIISKKQRVIELLGKKQWHDDHCCFTYDDFVSMDMCPSYEFGETYNDVIYAKRVLQELGYSCWIGGTLHVNRITDKTLL